MFVNGDNAQEPDLAGRKIFEARADQVALLEEPQLFRSRQTVFGRTGTGHFQVPLLDDPGHGVGVGLSSRPQKCDRPLSGFLIFFTAGAVADAGGASLVADVGCIAELSASVGTFFASPAWVEGVTDNGDRNRLSHRLS